MATIHKVRLTNVVYEGGDKRFNDEVFHFNSHNSALVLENGGGKTVFIHTVLQAILPHTNLGERKIKNTLQLENAPAHIGIEWLTNENPNRYVATVVTLFLKDHKLQSHKFVYEYGEGDKERLENMPFVIQTGNKKRPATQHEMAEYYQQAKAKSINAQTFSTNKSFHEYIEQNYHIVTNEWKSIVKINSDEGGIEEFFEHCRTTDDLFNRLLIPTVEESISGFEEGKFADVFEDRREGFKKYRDLKKSIKESEMIQQEIEKYVNQFASYSEALENYEATREKAKAIDLLLKEEKQQIEKMKELEEHAFFENEEKFKKLAKEKATYDILHERKKLATLDKDYRKLKDNYEDVNTKLQNEKLERNNLHYAKKKQELATYTERKQLYIEQLKEKDQEGSISDLQTALHEINAKIHGHFKEQIESYYKLIDNTKLQLRPLEEYLQEIKKEKNIKDKKERKLEKEVSDLNGQIRSNESLIHSIKQKILSNPEQEKLKDKYEQWLTKQAELDEQIIEAKNTLHIKNAEKIQVEQALKETLDKQNELEHQRKELLYEQKELNEAHDSTITELATVHATWQGIEDLYLQESTIKNRLIEMKQQRIKKKEEMLQKERLAHRFKDDYSEQTYFFTDPYLDEKINDWQNDLFVQTGTEYISSLQENERTKAQKYTLWPLTIVTIEKDRQELNRRINAIKERLAHPVKVITIEQAKQIIMSEQIQEQWITPAYWDKNLEREDFENWKMIVKAEATKMTKKREEADSLVEQINNLYKNTIKFFDAYPKETRDELQSSLQQLNREREKLERTTVTLNNHLEQITHTIEKNHRTIDESENKIRGIENLIEQAQQALQLKQKIASLQNAKKEKTNQIEQTNRKIDELNRIIKRHEEDISQLKEEINRYKNSIAILQEQELYKEVQHTEAQFSDDALDVMREKRKDINLKLEGYRQEYGELQAKIEYAEENIKRVNNDMEELVQQFSKIDRNYIFPIDGEQRLKRLNTTIKLTEQQRDKLWNLANEAKSKVDNQQGIVKAKEEQFEESFPNEELATFSIEFIKIETYLQEQEETLLEEKQYISSQLKRIESEVQKIDRACRKLDNFKEAHQFHLSDVSIISLSEREKTDFSYNREKIVTNITKKLKEQQEIVTEVKEQLDKAKRIFENFCHREITDQKLKYAVIEGMETKETYDEILDYRQDMLKTLENANRYARDYIAENDKDVQAFINNIHNHLLNVVEELKTIPNKTRVKVEDKSRNIYHFSIPEWSEEEGKLRLQEHIEQMVDELEKDHFKDEFGKEDANKVRRQLESWFNTKSLLQIVMENEKMRISCRKVTNDNQVSSRLTSWEQSNQWSGGEKWSKNMTLFLGLLNFVAEKKKQYNPNMKRNRAVILDNPFGKASSDHVLNPVFFIAEQLGFQMIALTAHADGKFLQDYFPIMYSLRLRNISEDYKQLMEAERHIHYAYFEDHEPEELEKLERREQLKFGV